MCHCWPFTLILIAATITTNIHRHTYTLILYSHIYYVLLFTIFLNMCFIVVVDLVLFLNLSIDTTGTRIQVPNFNQSVKLYLCSTFCTVLSNL